MFDDHSRREMRQQFMDAWQCYCRQQALTPLQQQIVALIHSHPEYQPMLDKAEQHLEKDYHAELGETNPFLHLSLHLAIREQLATHRPAIINTVFEQLCQQQKPHDAEHVLMQCLAETMWEMAQQPNPTADDQIYQQKLSALVNK